MPNASIPRRWWWRIPSARGCSGDGGFHRLHLGASSNGARQPTPQEFIVMTESGVNYSLEKLAPGQDVLFRRKRELQLQRMPVHAAEHARETARLRCAISNRAWNCRPNSCAARCAAHRAHARGKVMHASAATHRHFRPRRTTTCASASRTAATSAASTACRKTACSSAARGNPDLRRDRAFVRIAATLGVTKLRLTGGEPLLRRDLPRADRAS